MKAMEAEIERMIDQSSLFAVVLALQSACDSKARHLENQRLNRNSARAWHRVSPKLVPTLQLAQEANI